MAKKLKDTVSDRIRDEDKKYLEKFGDKLSDSTQYAQWISKPDEHEEHEGKSLATRNREVIKKWAKDRNAKPATVPGTEHGDRVVQQTPMDGPLGDQLRRDRPRTGEIAVLAPAHVRRQRWVVEQDVVLIVEVEAAAIEVG